MIGIHSIGSYVPETKINNMLRGAQFDREPDFIRDKIGFVELPRKNKTMETSDMCVEAFADLSADTDIEPENVNCVLVCTQNPDGYGLPHAASLVHEKLGLPSTVAAFDVSLGCSGFVYGLNLLANFMAGNAMGKGLLFTADPYSKIIDPRDYTTELLFGDAATCTLLTNNPTYVLGKTIFGTDGSKHQSICVDAETHYLAMNGKDVFNFTLRTVPQDIKSCVKQNNLSMDDVDLFLLHQASKYIIENMRKRLGVPSEKIPFLAATHGNTVSSTIPLMLERYIKKGPKTILISGFGVGLSWASTILQRL